MKVFPRQAEKRVLERKKHVWKGPERFSSLVPSLTDLVNEHHGISVHWTSSQALVYKDKVPVHMETISRRRGNG